MSAEALTTIAKAGLRVFVEKDIEHLFEDASYSKKYLSKMLNLMAQKGYLNALGKGIYTLPVELLSGGPIHSFEIALKLAKKGAISHRSAMVHHNLTDQMVSTVYVTSPREEGANLSSSKEYKLQGIHCYLLRVLPEHYWGTTRTFIGETALLVTDLEKTIIDGLTRPQLCGGMREVIVAFEKGLERCSFDTLCNYAEKTSIAACKRLGWFLEYHKENAELQQQLASIPMKYYQKLDPSGTRKGTYNRRWMLVENI